MSKKKKYDKSFKQQAIEFALSSNQPLSKTAKDLGMLERTLYSWVYKAKSKKMPLEGPVEPGWGNCMKSS